jgi:hypothetical protein
MGKDVSLGGRFDYFAAFVLPAMGADAMRHFRFVAIGALGVGGLAEGVVSAAVLGARVGVSAFRIRHFVSTSLLSQIFKSLNVQVFQSHPPVVARWGPACAAGFIAVCAADGADAFAGIAAHPLHGKLQQQLLPHNVLKLQAGQFIETHLGLTFVDCYFLFARRSVDGAVKEVEWSIYMKRCPAEAAITLGFQIGLDAAVNPNFLTRVGKKFRDARDLQRALLNDAGVGKIELTGLPGFRKR